MTSKQGNISSEAGPGYVLGTGMDELQRLRLQHRLWADAASALWRLARVQAGMQVVDLGCGPGYTTLELADLVTAGSAQGRVIGVDESGSFLESLRQQAKLQGREGIEVVQGDVQRLDALLSPHLGEIEVAYARWVLCFVPRPEAVVASVSRLLRPGGRFAIHDFFNYGATSTAPRRASHDRAVAATLASWRAQGGDPDICGRLPALLEEHGLEVVHLAMHQRVARPRDSMFAWADSWWKNFAPRLVQMGFLRPEEASDLFRDLAEIKASRSDYLVPPPVTEILAIKR